MALVAIGAHAPEEGKALGLPFPILSDPDLEVTKRYGLLHEGGWMGKDVPRPATLLIDKEGIIRWAHIPSNIRPLPSPDDIFEELRK